MVNQFRKNNKLKVFAFIGLLAMSASTARAQDGSNFIDENNAYFGPTLPATEDEIEYSGAYYTGDYTSPFKTYLGKTDEEIQEKLDNLWNHYFKGDYNSKVYYETIDGAYIEDINNRDVRSEGMSYGMMICVQTNHKEEFDKLWNWAKNHMWRKSGTWDGYFTRSCNTTGSPKYEECTPDAEMYFMMSLLFAANRWGDESYMEDAQYILNKMWSNPECSLINPRYNIISFLPYGSDSYYTNPSYDLPAFLDLFARWSATYQDKWKRAAQETRNHLYKSSNTHSGLFSDYNNFDGTPHSVPFNNTAINYMYDAMRCAMNFGMDYYLFSADAIRQTEMAKRIIDFFEKDGYKHARFTWDGNPVSSDGYTQGERGANAVATYALMNEDGYEDQIKKNLQMAWDTKFMTGQYRYYDGMLHYLAMLHLCGAFKIWKGMLIPPTPKTDLVYNGSEMELTSDFSTTMGSVMVNVDGGDYGTDIPKGQDAKEYTINYFAGDSPVFSFKVTIAPKNVSNPTIKLSQTNYYYDGMEKMPTVTVEDGETIIPASEYTVTYENNTNIGTATVIITDKEGGNYIVNGATTFEIDIKGDVNSDKKLDAVDIVAILNMIFTNSYDIKADANNDGKVDVADIIAIVNIMSES